MVLPICTIPYLFVSYFKFYTTDLGTDAFRLPLAIWYGKHKWVETWCDVHIFLIQRAIFDWRTPTAYFFAFICEMLGMAYAMIVGLVPLIHALGACWILIAFIDDIKTDMSTLIARKKKGISVAKLYVNLIEFIHLREEMKQLSHAYQFKPIWINNIKAVTPFFLDCLRNSSVLILHPLC